MTVFSATASAPAVPSGLPRASRAVGRWKRRVLAGVAAVLLCLLTVWAWADGQEVGVDTSWFEQNPAAQEYTLTSADQLRGLAQLVKDEGLAPTSGGFIDVEDGFAGVTFHIAGSGANNVIDLGGASWQPIGTSEHPFNGIVDGAFNGKPVVVRGLTVDGRWTHGSTTEASADGTSFMGMFGFCGPSSRLSGVVLESSDFSPNQVIASVGSLTTAQLDSLALAGDSYLMTQARSAAEVKGCIRYVGSLVGYTEGALENCSSDARVTVTNYTDASAGKPALVVADAGGLAGVVAGSMTDCAFTGRVLITAPSAPSNLSDAIVTCIGGVAGRVGEQEANGTVTAAGSASRCRNEGTVWVRTEGIGGLDRFGVQKEATSAAVGGVAGYSFGSLEQCDNYGVVNTNLKEVCTVRSFADVSDDAKNNYLYDPDFVWSDEDLAENPNLTAANKEVEAENYFKIANGGTAVGGVVGALYATVQGASYSFTETTANPNATADGSASEQDNRIQVRNCVNMGYVVGLANTGGIVGQSGAYTQVTQSLNGHSGYDLHGGVVTTRWNKPMTGGIIGRAAGEVSYCANQAEVQNIQTGYYTAGIAGALGSNWGDTPELFACFNSGQVHVTSNATQTYREAGLVGNNNGNVHDCIMRKGCVLAAQGDPDEADDYAGIIGDDSMGIHANLYVLPANASEMTDADAALLGSSQAAAFLNVTGYTQGWDTYWYITTDGVERYPTLNIWNEPANPVDLTDKSVTAQAVAMADYAGVPGKAVPELSVTLSDGTVLVQNADFYVVPQADALDITEDAATEADRMPYQASIVGIGNYAGRLDNVCSYGIGRCNLENCTVSVAPATYNFGAAVFPDWVKVASPSGDFLGEDEYSYRIYHSQTFNVEQNGLTQIYVVYDSEGYVSFDDGATLVPVSDPGAHEKLAGDLRRTNFTLYDRDKVRISDGSFTLDENGEPVCTTTVYDPRTGAVAPGESCVAYKASHVDAYQGHGVVGAAGYVVRVDPTGTSATVKDNSWAYGAYVISAIDLYRDADVDEVTVPGAGENGTDALARWDAECSLLYLVDPETGEDLITFDKGDDQARATCVHGHVQATFDFAARSFAPLVKLSYNEKDDDGNHVLDDEGNRVKIADIPVSTNSLATRNARVVYGDPLTAQQGLSWVNRDVTPLTKPARPGAATNGFKPEKAAVIVRTANESAYTNYLYMYFDIDPVSIDDCDLSIDYNALEGESYGWAPGNVVRPQVTAKIGDENLLQGVDYTLTYRNNTKTTTDLASNEAISAIETLARAGITDLSRPFAVDQYGAEVRQAVESLNLASVTVAGIRTKKGADWQYDGNVIGEATLYYAIAQGKDIADYFDLADIPDQIVGFSDGLPCKDMTPHGGIELTAKEAGTEEAQEGRDYTVSYRYSKKVNAYTTSVDDLVVTVTVTGTGEYRGSLQKTFRVKPIDLSDESSWLVSSNGQAIADYAGTAPGLNPARVCLVYRSAIPYGSDTNAFSLIAMDVSDWKTGSGKAYLSLNNNHLALKFYNARTGKSVASLSTAAPGSYYVVVEPKSLYFTGSHRFDFEIVKDNLATTSNVMFRNPDTDVVYNGAPQEPMRIIAYMGGLATVDPASICTMTYEDNVQAGTARWTAVAKPNSYYEGTRTGTFTIQKLNLSTAKNVTIDVYDAAYNSGKPVVPPVVVRVDGNVLTEGVDYTLTCSNNTAVGDSAQVVIKGMGSCTGSVTKTFSVSSKLKMSKAKIIVPDQVYTGQAIKPEPTVTYGGQTLVKNHDYVVLSYANTDKLSTPNLQASVTIQGMGAYTGTATGYFNMVKGLDIAKASADSIADQRYTGFYLTPAVRLVYSGEVLQEGAEADYTLRYRHNLRPGTAEVIVTGQGRFTGSTKTITFAITGEAPPIDNTPSDNESVEEVSYDHLVGIDSANAVETAALTALEAYPLGTGKAVLSLGASAEDTMQALSVAGALKCPVLLVSGNGVPSVTAHALRALGCTEVYLVGEGLRDAVDALTGILESSTRKVINWTESVDGALYEKADTAYVIEGEGKLDVAAALLPAMIKGGSPVFFTSGENSLSDETCEALSQWLAPGGAKRLVMAGVDKKALPNNLIEDTSVTVCEVPDVSCALTQLLDEDFHADGSVLVRGTDLSDGLTAAVLSARRNSLLIPLDDDLEVLKAVMAHESWKTAPADTFYALGGAAAFDKPLCSNLNTLLGW